MAVPRVEEVRVKVETTAVIETTSTVIVMVLEVVGVEVETAEELIKVEIVKVVMERVLEVVEVVGIVVMRGVFQVTDRNKDPELTPRARLFL